MGASGHHLPFYLEQNKITSNTTSDQKAMANQLASRQHLDIREHAPRRGHQTKPAK